MLQFFLLASPLWEDYLSPAFQFVFWQAVSEDSHTTGNNIVCTKVEKG